MKIFAVTVAAAMVAFALARGSGMAAGSFVFSSDRACSKGLALCRGVSILRPHV